MYYHHDANKYVFVLNLVSIDQCGHKKEAFVFVVKTIAQVKQLIDSRTNCLIEKDDTLDVLVSEKEGPQLQKMTVHEVRHYLERFTPQENNEISESNNLFLNQMEKDMQKLVAEKQNELYKSSKEEEHLIKNLP